MGGIRAKKGGGPTTPLQKKSEGRRGAVGFYLVVAATTGMRAGAVGVVSVLSPAAIVTPSVACLFGVYGEWFCRPSAGRACARGYVRVASGVRLVHYVGATCEMIPCV